MELGLKWKEEERTKHANDVTPETAYFSMGAYDYDLIWKLKIECAMASINLLSSDEEVVANAKNFLAILKNLWKHPRTILPERLRIIVDKGILEVQGDLIKVQYMEEYNLPTMKIKFIITQKVELLHTVILDTMQVVGMGIRSQYKEQLSRRIERGLLQR